MPEISAKQRTDIGKQLYALRKEGILPAVLYGPDVEAIPLAVPKRDFEKVLREAGETSLVTLKLENNKTYNVLIHDVAKDPLTLEPIHADFYAVRMDKPIAAKVPLAFVGESPAVKNESGILIKVLHELEVKALPKDLPHEITVDLARLQNIHGRIHVSDLVLPGGVSAHAPADEVIAIVEPPRSAAELEGITKTETAAPMAEVKTEREIKAEVKAESKAAEESGGQ